MIVFVMVMGLVVASSQISSLEVSASRRTLDDVRATALAEAGVERAKADLENAVDKTRIFDPLEGVRGLFAGGDTVRVFDAEPMIANGANVGEYTTQLSLDVDQARRVVVTITSAGYVPAAPQNLRDGERLQAWDSVSVTVEYELETSEVFDYAYFINNWGWLYGNSIEIGGNARSNGQMDLGGYKPKILGSPTYDDIDYSSGSAVLGERLTDGGLYSGFDIVNADRARGLAADEEYHFDFEDSVEMPNLSDLSRYEDRARSQGASITIDGVVMADGVVGDDSGESEHLYLVGTRQKPIVIDGPVVVRGDIVISGYVTGQGSIYSGGNVYVPDSIEYLNGPPQARPVSNNDQNIKNWLSHNMNSDFLGLFARENVVVGDFTDSTWRSYVGGWLNSPLNESREDSGEDLIPNTRVGRDGVSGTADDDLLEGDGVFTTEYYSADDAARGIIPPGFNVGDRIPGTGEDIDGDGKFDDRIDLSDFDLQETLDPSLWEGNMPGGIGSYGDIASMQANHLDAVFYTNHAFGWTVLGPHKAELNGALIARNESIVYGTPSMHINHDSRLLGGTDAFVDEMLPVTLRPMHVLQWRRNETDVFQAQP